MDKQSLIMDILSKPKEELLIDKLNKIESMLFSDIVSFYGYIENRFADLFIRLIEELKNKSTNNKLTIILHSMGGESDAINMIYEKIYTYYRTIDIVIPKQVVSGGVIFTFMADCLYVNTMDSALSMIEPQVMTGSGVNVSIFNEFNANNIKYKLINCADIDKSIIIDDTTDELYKPNFNAKKIGLLKLRKLCYEMLINHFLKDCKNKEEQAIRFINYLMDINFHTTHDFPIYFRDLEKFELKTKRYTDDEKLNKAIMEYDDSMRYIIGKSNDYFYNTSGYGNYINCILQSKYRTII